MGKKLNIEFFFGDIHRIVHVVKSLKLWLSFQEVKYVLNTEGGHNMYNVQLYNVHVIKLFKAISVKINIYRYQFLMI